MDIDIFFLESKKDPYEIVKENLDEFDTSDYPDKHLCFNIKNVIGKLKYEINGIL